MSRQHQRRTVLAVPGSNPRMIDKARGLGADALFLDLEDAVAAAAKDEARGNVAGALRQGGFGTTLVTVRINALSTPHALNDLEAVVTAGGAPEAIVMPKVQSAADIHWLDHTLGQLEQRVGIEPGGIGIEAQIEDARGLLAIEAIATASPRMEALVFGPGDFSASLQMRTVTVGAQPVGVVTGDAFHHILMQILVTARAHGLQAIDGPYLAIPDLDGLRSAARHAAGLGFDGKWVLHPGQVDAANEVYSPRQEDYDQAELILDAYAFYTSAEGGAKGAVMLGDEMIDEASRKMAIVIAAKGRAAGMTRTQAFTPPA